MQILKKFWHEWMRFGHFMGDIVGRVVMTLFYFTLLLPFGVIVTLFSDPLDKKDTRKSPVWHARTTGDRTLEEARRQF
jgi:hypothetical protein